MQLHRWMLAGIVAVASATDQRVATSVRQAQELADRGEFERARERLAEVVRDLEQSRTDGPVLAQTLNELGLVHHALGSFSQAERTYRRAIRVAEQHPRKSSLILSILEDNLAAVFLDLGRYREAETLRLSSLRGRTLELGPDDPEIGKQLSNLATVYMVCRKYDEAARALQRALQIFETAYGPAHEHTASILHNLGVLMTKVGRYGEATEQFSRAILILENKLGTSHPTLVRPLINHARAELCLNHSSQAEASAVRALQIAEAVYSPGPPLIAEALFAQAESLRKTKRKAEAREAERRPRAIRDAHPDRGQSDAVVHVSELAESR